MLQQYQISLRHVAPHRKGGDYKPQQCRQVLAESDNSAPWWTQHRTFLIK